MSDLGAFLARLVAALDGAGIPHMIAGSFASTLHGVPRTTQDIDVVIDPTRSSLETLLTSLPAAAYYVSGEAARDALARRGMFNVIDLATGWKADLVVRKARTFSVTELTRRVRRRMLDVDVFVATPEDTILSKLEWSKLSGGSERQLRDVAGIVEVHGVALDHEYIEHWAAELGVTEAWRRIHGVD